MTYDDRRKSLWVVASGTVIYRSKMHLGLKRNFQVLPAAQWLELLCKHIPDRHEHLMRYVGWYSNRAHCAVAPCNSGFAPFRCNPHCKRASTGAISFGGRARQR